MRIEIADVGTLIAEQFDHIEGGAFAYIIDIAFVGCAQNQNF